MKKVMINQMKLVSCENCKVTQEVIWGDFGAEYPCINCESAPVSLHEVTDRRNQTINLSTQEIKIIKSALIDYSIKTEDLKNEAHSKDLNGLLVLFVHNL